MAENPAIREGAPVAGGWPQGALNEAFERAARLAESSGGRVCVLCGSPRKGACAALARRVAEGVGSAGAVPDLVFLADCAIAGCVGCGACERTGSCVFDAGERRRLREGSGRPGAAWLVERLEAADALALVAPVYFSGPPSQLKALFDRMQPLWCQRYALHVRPVLPPAERKPFELFAVGGGGDPFGYGALVSCAHAALRMADFELRATHDFVGRM